MMADLAASRRAALALFIVGVYLQIVEWVDLFPWNSIRNGNGQETVDLAMGVATAALTAMLWRGWRIAAIASTLAVTLWAWLQIQSWWIPYFSGASPGWARQYEHWFGNTTAWLPRSAERLPPDANHLVLHALIAVALVLCLAASFSTRRAT